MSKLLALHWKRLVIPITFLAVCALILGASYTPSFRQCAQGYQQQTGSHESGHLAKKIKIIVRCDGAAIDANNGTLTAIATLFLAYITYLLVSLGQEEAEAAKIQSRAYLSVGVGRAIYQEQTRDPPLKFEGKPILRNSGQTPARGVRYRAKAAIIPNNLVGNFQFVIAEDIPDSGNSIGPGETNELSGIVDGFIAEEDVPDVKRAKDACLWVWGTVLYEDAFGDGHFTKFCIRHEWLPNGQIYGSFDPKHSDSN